MPEAVLCAWTLVKIFWLAALLHVNGKEPIKLKQTTALFRMHTVVHKSHIPSIFHRRFSYSPKEPWLSVIFIHFYTRRSIKWCWIFYHYCAHLKIHQSASKYCSIQILILSSWKVYSLFFFLLSGSCLPVDQEWDMKQVQVLQCISVSHHFPSIWTFVMLLGGESSFNWLVHHWVTAV